MSEDPRSWGTGPTGDGGHREAERDDGDAATLLSDAGGMLADAGVAAHLARWAAEARVDEAAAARTRERWLRQAAGESASLAGVLVDLAERGTPAVLHTVGGRRRRGVVRAVGVDFCIVSGDGTDASELIVALGAVQALRPEAGVAPVGDRTIEVDVSLVEAIGILAADRPRVLVVSAAGERLAGELREVGRDVLTLRMDGEPASIAYIPVSAVAELTIAG